MKNDHLDHHNRARPNSITPDELKLIHQHRVDDAAHLEQVWDANDARAVELGAALKILKGEA